MGTGRGPAVRTSALSKFYGRHVGVVHLDLEVDEGEVYGLLGPNGAGKTTTIRTLLGLIRPTSGSAEVLGLPLSRGVEIRRGTGYLPGDLALYDRMTAAALLEHLARLRGGLDRGRMRALAERLDLDLDRRVRELSRGNRQKVGVVQAFLHRPRLLVLDEPTSGLDPLVQQEFQALVRESQDQGATVLLSSHVLAEVQHLADRVAIMDRGRLVVVDTVDGLREKATKQVELDFACDPPPALSSAPGVREVRVHGRTAVCTVVGPVGGLVSAASAYGLVDVHTHDPDLEDAFFGYLGGADHVDA